MAYRLLVCAVQVIHSEAQPSAVFYVATILLLYVIGLIVILVHYMNASYGTWNWSLSDVWDELRPSKYLIRTFFSCVRSSAY